MGVVVIDLDVGDSASVLLERGLHDLGLVADLPDSDLALHASGDDALAVVGGLERGDSVVVSVVDGIEKLARLWQESPDLSVVPAREDRLSIGHEFDGVALESWNLDSEELLSGLGVPNADVVDRGSGEELRVAAWEGDVVNALAVAGVSQLWGNAVGVAPVDGGLGCSCEEVGSILGKGYGCASTHDFALGLHKHLVGVNLSDGAIATTNKEVAVWKERHAVETLGEEPLGRSNPLEKVHLQIDLNDVSCHCSKEAARIVWRDDDALVNSLDLAHLEVSEEDLLLLVVDAPHTEAIVVDGYQFLVGLVVEGDLVCHIHANSVSTDSLAARNLI